MKVEINGNISQEMEVTNLSEYIEKAGLDTDDDDLYERADMEIIGRIIALDVAYFLMRRAPYLCASNIDILIEIRRDLIKHLTEAMGLTFFDFNKDIDW